MKAIGFFVLFAAAASAGAAAFTWGGYHQSLSLNGGAAFHQADVSGSGIDVTVALSGSPWTQYQAGGQLSLAPSAHGELAWISIQWSAAVDFRIDFERFAFGQFRHAAGAFEGAAVTYESLHGATDDGDWISNGLQWDHDGRFTVVSTGAATEIRFAITTLPGTSSAAPYWSTIVLPQISFTAANHPGVQIPEPAHWGMIAAALVIALAVFWQRERHWRAAKRTKPVDAPTDSVCEFERTLTFVRERRSKAREKAAEYRRKLDWANAEVSQFKEALETFNETHNAVLEQLAAARKDGERLDWLDSCDSFNIEPKYHHACQMRVGVQMRGFGPDPDQKHIPRTVGDTIRAAIDAAKAAMEGGER